MVTADIVIYSLVGLNIFQFVYWSRLQTRLIDKLMCRNYAEYVQLTKPAEPQVEKFEVMDDQIGDESILRELNGMMGT